MNEAPEQIWLDGDVEVGDGYFPRCFEDRKPCNEPAISYTRTDVAQAQVASAYEAAKKAAFHACKSAGAGYVDENERLLQRAENEFRLEVVTAIRALTPTDAKAALDRIIAEAVKEALQVKPLVWVHRPDEPQGYTWKARKPFGSAYYLHEKDGQHSWGGEYIPLEDAKAAAQADYAARILSALKGGEA